MGLSMLAGFTVENLCHLVEYSSELLPLKISIPTCETKTP